MASEPDLPYWLRWINALAPLISGLATIGVGVVAGWIAHGQWAINRDKLKLDHYDRRFEVYQAMRELIVSVQSNGTTTDEELRKYLQRTRQAKFLLNAKIADFRKELYNRASRLQLSHKLREGPAPDKVHAAAANSRAENTTWFLEQEQAIEALFEPFLQLRA